ncbi:MAG: NUDIX hydrolase [Sphingomonadales bacterium]|nr:NUDIX hydrolase [Sphingomonadales bacterium]
MSRFIEIVQGLLGRRPAYLQVGAICLRTRKGRREVLMISSLDTGRWIIPKGWPMKGRSLAGAALREAWEEAGVKGEVAHDTVGSYAYLKQQSGGLALRCEVNVYLVETDSLSEHYPEAGKRDRQWMAPEAAAESVAEEGLSGILRGL